VSGDGKISQRRKKWGLQAEFVKVMYGIPDEAEFVNRQVRSV
jgi:hypothetical protein